VKTSVWFCGGAGRGWQLLIDIWPRIWRTTTRKLSDWTRTSGISYKTAWLWGSHDRASIQTFVRLATFRSASADASRYGGPLIFVNPANTSQTCRACGWVTPRLRGYVVMCPACQRWGGQEVGTMNVARRGVEFLSGGDGCIAARLRQRLVGDPGGLSSDFGMKARLPARKQACLRGQEGEYAANCVSPRARGTTKRGGSCGIAGHAT